MKVAILSDIHGNMQALESVMADIKENNCEKVLCLGDLAMAGPEPAKVIDFVKSQNNWIVIQGNTDKMISDFTPEILKNTENAFPVMAHALAVVCLIALLKSILAKSKCRIFLKRQRCLMLLRLTPKLEKTVAMTQ